MEEAAVAMSEEEANGMFLAGGTLWYTQGPCMTESKDSETLCVERNENGRDAGYTGLDCPNVKSCKLATGYARRTGNYVLDGC